jgi:hypothetical protein
MSVDLATKHALLKLRREQDLQYTRSFQTLEQSDCFIDPANVDLNEPSLGRRLVVTCLPFLLRLNGSATNTATAATGSTAGTAARLFAKAPSPSDRLALVQKKVEARVEVLDARAEAARTQAKALMKAGKKAEAMTALKRSRALASSSTALHTQSLALEQQLDGVEAAKMQAEMTASLGIALKASKKATRGLLDKTEHAVETGGELLDQAEDVRNLFSELRVGSVDEDDSELEAELESMCQSESTHASASPASAPQPQIAAYPSAPSTVVAAGQVEVVATAGLAAAR